MGNILQRVEQHYCSATFCGGKAIAEVLLLLLLLLKSSMKAIKAAARQQFTTEGKNTTLGWTVEQCTCRAAVLCCRTVMLVTRQLTALSEQSLWAARLEHSKVQRGCHPGPESSTLNDNLMQNLCDNTA